MGFWFDMFDMFVGILMGPQKKLWWNQCEISPLREAAPPMINRQGIDFSGSWNNFGGEKHLPPFGQIWEAPGPQIYHPQFQRIPWTTIPMKKKGCLRVDIPFSNTPIYEEKHPSPPFEWQSTPWGQNDMERLCVKKIMDERKVPWTLSFWEGTPIEIPIQAWYSMFS